MNEKFSAAQIAVALGKTKRAVQLAMSGIPSTQVSVRGQLADAWKISSLPARYQRQLESIAARDCYRDCEQLLSEPRERWKPSLPVSEIAQQHIDRAVKLREALRESVRLSDGNACPATGFEHFCRTYGRVTKRHWRRLLRRTIERDAGEGLFDDLTLYLDQNPGRRRANTAAALVRNDSERAILDQLNCVKAVENPSAIETAKIWCVVCEQFDQCVERGVEQYDDIKRRMLRIFESGPVSLARTRDALRKKFARKYEQWCKGGKTFQALEDRRPVKSGWHRRVKLTEEERLKLIGHARINCGGRISPAYRDLYRAGELSAEHISHYIGNPRSKSYVPKPIRREVTADVRRLAAYHLGPREHKLRGAHHTRDWKGVAAGDWFQSDDLTAPVYFWKKNDHAKIELTRGQFLPMIDERTTFILGFILIQERNYTSFDIRNVITTTCSEHGLPRRGFSFERGIWQSSKLIAGSKNADLEESADTGLRRLGMRLRHATTPRAKVIERTLGQLQDLMEGLPGYCGRNEQLEKFERLQRAMLDIKAGRAEPETRLFNAEQIVIEFARIIDRYNGEPQQGSKLDGLSPKEGWAQLQGAEPRIRFDDRLMYFLASHLMKLRIGRNGLAFHIGKQRFNYKGEETGRRQGEIVYAWFNAMRPDLLPCTTELPSATNRAPNTVFTVQRSHDLPAVDAPNELLAAENSKVEAHNGYARSLYYNAENTLPGSFFRRNDLIGADAIRLGQEIDAQRKSITRSKKTRARLDAQLDRATKAAGIPRQIARDDSDALEAAKRFKPSMEALERLAKEEVTQ